MISHKENEHNCLEEYLSHFNNWINNISLRLKISKLSNHY